MLNVKKPIILAGLVTAWPVLCFGASDPNMPWDLGDDNNLLVKMAQAVIFIVVLGGIAVYLSKKIMPKFRPMSGNDINVRETIHLGPNKTVHLVEVGEKTFFIGSTSDSITMLADVSKSLETGLTN